MTNNQQPSFIIWRTQKKNQWKLAIFQKFYTGCTCKNNTVSEGAWRPIAHYNIILIFPATNVPIEKKKNQ